MSTSLIAWITRAIIFGSVVMFGAIGETLTEKSGNLNLGTPGIMAVGGAMSFVVNFLYEQNCPNPSRFVCVVLALAVGFLSAALVGLLYSVLTTSLRANQNVTGLTITIFGVGFAKFVALYVIPTGAVSIKATLSNEVFSARLFYIPALGVFSELLLSYGFMMYLAILLAIATHFFLYRSRTGMNLRAVGENPATADAAGISVTRYKYLATCVGAGISGLGGIYYVLDYSYGTWATAAGSSIESLAWLSVALVIFASWKPLNIIWGSYIFGMCFWAYNYVPVITGWQINTDLAQMLPYVVTIVVLIISSIKKSMENPAPTSLGLTYFREER